MKRRLFTLAAALSLLLWCVTVALWMRSYSRAVSITWGNNEREHELVIAWGGAYAYSMINPNRVSSIVTPSRLSARSDPMASQYQRPDPFVRTSYAFGFGAGSVPYRFVEVPLWFATLFFVVLPLWWLLRQGRRANVGTCPTCGYDLRGTPDRCPECGKVPVKATTP